MIERRGSPLPPQASALNAGAGYDSLFVGLNHAAGHSYELPEVVGVDDEML
jgi:hypothetical protein